MQPFNYADRRAVHILATYISEGYLFPDVIQKDSTFILVTPKVVHKYNLVWDSGCDKVHYDLFTNTVYIPRHIKNHKVNTRLESILYYGFDLFKVIAYRELFFNHPFTYVMLRFKNNDSNTFAIAKRLKKFFKFLQRANKSLIHAYNNYPNNPVNLKSLDSTLVRYQSHIFLASTLFELYHPSELL